MLQGVITTAESVAVHSFGPGLPTTVTTFVVFSVTVLCELNVCDCPAFRLKLIGPATMVAPTMSVMVPDVTSVVPVLVTAYLYVTSAPLAGTTQSWMSGPPATEHVLSTE